MKFLDRIFALCGLIITLLGIVAFANHQISDGLPLFVLALVGYLSVRLYMAVRK